MVARTDCCSMGTTGAWPRAEVVMEETVALEGGVVDIERAKGVHIDFWTCQRACRMGQRRGDGQCNDYITHPAVSTACSIGMGCPAWARISSWKPCRSGWFVKSRCRSRGVEAEVYEKTAALVTITTFFEPRPSLHSQQRHHRHGLGYAVCMAVQRLSAMCATNTQRQWHTTPSLHLGHSS
jgi:hypothetical protein